MSSLTFADVKPILIRSGKIALIVGPILTLINQWEAITSFELPDMTKVVLTFLVPFCVSFFSGYALRKSLAKQMCATQAVIEDLRSDVQINARRAQDAEDQLRALQTEIEAKRDLAL